MTNVTISMTLFDYLRVLFHRWHWIVGLIALPALFAWVWIDWITPKQYQSALVVMAWRRDLDNPHMRRMIESTPMNSLLTRIRDRLKIESNLRNLAGNIRYVVKIDYALRHEQAERLSGVPSATRRAALQRELGALAQGRLVVLAGEGSLRRPMEIFRRDYRRNLVLEDLPRQIDTQGLAIALGAVRFDENPDRDLTAMLILDPETDAVYVGALRQALFGKASTAKYPDVRLAAERALFERLRREVKTPGAGGFDDIQTRALLREIQSIPFLMDTELYYAVSDSVGNRPAGSWINQLKYNLDVNVQNANLLTFRFEEDRFGMHPPFYRRNGSNLISHLVVQTTFSVLQGQFRSMEEKFWTEATETLQTRKKSLLEEMDTLNKNIYNLENLRNLQLDNLIRLPADSEDAASAVRVKNNWTDAFLGAPQSSTHILRMDKKVQECEQLERELLLLNKDLEKIKAYLADPTHAKQIQVRTQTVEKGDTPEVVSLKQKLSMKKIELGRLLEKNTDKHPQVVKLCAEIDRIQAELRNATNAMAPETRLEKIETENPDYLEQKREQDNILRKIDVKQVELKYARDTLTQEKKKAEDAIAGQFRYKGWLERQQRVTRELSALEAREESMNASRDMGENFPVEFVIHTKAQKPTDYFAPKRSLVFLMALLIGFLAAGTAVFLLEYTDHSIKSSEDIRRHFGLPVLGTIPEFGFSEVEHSGRLWERVRMMFSARRRGPYPIPIDKQEPLPLRQRAKLTPANRWGVKRLLLILLIPVALAFFLGGGISCLESVWRKYADAAVKTDANSAAGDAGTTTVAPARTVPVEPATPPAAPTPPAPELPAP